MLFAFCLQAQAPQKFSYQTVIRNASNQLLVGQTVGIKISILQGSANGSAVYSETHAPQTNANGLATLEIGGGSLLSGNFANINWANGPFFVKTETDPNGGNNYTITNTSQLLSVPYALYASSANTSNNGVPAGGTNGQFLTNCNGIATWTTAGQCPGTIASINCSAGGSNTGTLTVLQSASGVSSIISYTGGGGGTHNGQTVTSTGVTGLTAILAAGTFAIGTGSLTYTITGTPASIGTASFALNIGGQSCTKNLTVNSSGVGTPATCGATNVHNPAKTYDSMTDQQGNLYKTIVIGTQEWMAENLKTTIYRNGNAIANVTDNTQWTGLTTGAWVSYNNDSQYDCPYGKLYNWYAVVDPRNVCPTGWHVPSDNEWITLWDYLGGAGGAGGKMKTTGTQYWVSPNGGATNESGFSGLPGGFRVDNFGSDGFANVGVLGGWWSTYGSGVSSAFNCAIFYNDGLAGESYDDKRGGWSVRCIKD